MKRILTTLALCSAFLFISMSTHAQTERYNRFSVGITGGVDVPLIVKNSSETPNNIARSKYITFPQVQLSMRYMFNPKFGLKGHYGYSLFKDSRDLGSKITYHRLVLEGVVNIGQLIEQPFYLNLGVPRQLSLLVHGGAGLTLAHYENMSSNPKYGNVTLGFTGELKLSERFAFMADLSFIGNLQQKGYLEKANQIQLYANVGIGVVYYLGHYKKHADWW